MVEISLSGSGEGPGWATAPGYSTGVLRGPVIEWQVTWGISGWSDRRRGIQAARRRAREKERAAREAHRLHVAEREALLAKGPLDLVVWPETAYVQGVRLPLPVDVSLIRGPVLGRARVPLLLVTTSLGAHPDGWGYSNSVLLAGPDGRVESAYHKNILSPWRSTCRARSPRRGGSPLT